MDLSVLHLDNTANVAWNISQGLNKLGVNSKVMMLSNKFNFPCDYPNYYNKNLFGKIKCARDTIRVCKDFDIVHTHGGITRNRVDLVYIKKILHKPLVVHYHGTDARSGNGLHHVGIVDKKIVSTIDLKDWLPDAVFIPNPVMVNDYKWNTPVDRVRIIHVPNKREIKGTDKIIEAVGLAKKKVVFDFKIIENVSHDTVLFEMGKSHFVIDWFNPVFGINGVISLEAMSMGVIPICFVKPEYQEKNSPIVMVDTPTVDCLADCIVGLVNSKKETLNVLSRLCYKYVQVFRNPVVIAKQYIPIYEEILGNG